MRKDHFAGLKQVIGALRPEELKVARKFVITFDSNISARKNKSLALFNAIVQNPDISKEKAVSKIKFDGATTSFDRLVKRLKERVLESTILAVNIERKDAFSDPFVQKFRIRKYLVAWMVIGGRGMRDEANNLLEKVITSSKKYELYAELVEALTIHKGNLVLTSASKEKVEAIERDIEFYKEGREAVSLAISWYYSYYAEVGRSTHVSKMVGLLEEALEQLYPLWRQLKSATVYYFFALLLIEYCIAIEDDHRGILVGLELTRVIISTPAIFIKGRAGAALGGVARNQLNIFDFENAIKNAREAQWYHRKIKFNFQGVQETEVFGLYFANRLTEAFQLLNTLLEATDEAHFGFYHSKRSYMKACILFSLRDFKKCNFVLNDTRELDKDREGWNIGIRLLSIMSSIELEQFDLAGDRIEALRKHLSRVKKGNEVRERDLIIHKILQSLEKQAFDFKSTWQLRQADFQRLASNEKEVHWKVVSPEMIIFHHWFADKMENKPYEFRVPEALKMPAPKRKLAEFENYHFEA